MIKLTELNVSIVLDAHTMSTFPIVGRGRGGGGGGGGGDDTAMEYMYNFRCFFSFF